MQTQISYNKKIQKKLINIIKNNLKIGIYKDNDTKLINFIKNLKFSEPIFNGNGLGYTIPDDTFNSFKSIHKFFDENRNTRNNFEDFYSYITVLFPGSIISDDFVDFLNSDQNLKYIPKDFNLSKIEKKILEIKKRFSLDQIYYKYNFLLNHNDNDKKAMEMLNNLEKELQKISKLLKLKNDNLVGKNILSISLDSRKIKSDNALYKSISNTLHIYQDVNSNILHEYIHFLDKNNILFLLFNKNSQQLFEENILNVNELFYFSCETFDLIKNIEQHSKFDIQTSIFKKQILQHDFNDFIYNALYYHKNEKENVRSLNKNILSWLTRNNLNSKELMMDIENAINKKPIDKSKYSDTIKLVFNYIEIYHKNNEINDNNYIKMSKNLDTHNDQIYYARLKEVLARSIEGKYNGYQFKELSNKLTTPKISDKNYEKLIEILKNWSDNIDKNLNQSSLSSKIKAINLKLRGNEEQIKKIKRMS